MFQFNSLCANRWTIWLGSTVCWIRIGSNDLYETVIQLDDLADSSVALRQKPPFLVKNQLLNSDLCRPRPVICRNL
jgi:hypothetical protein